ncbi:MFS transporter [Cytobacillus sp. FJAT-54145]|uniref:MFS transporter n=1 Tax=Cytobacillus spartinae TaxID=3299023 RepID=A0ABW6KJL5_9BACI
METVALTRNPMETKVRNIALSIYLMGIFMGALDHGIVGPALTSIVSTFNISTSWGVWSFTIYTLLFAVSIPLMGKFSDRFGRKQIFMLGIALFGIGSLLAAFAPNYLMFLVGRSVQAIGTGGIFPITAAFIAVSYPQEARAKVMGLIGVIFSLGSILGPIIGGYIIQNLDWTWIFLINIPISILVLVSMSALKLPQVVMKKPVDFAGIVLLTTVIFLIMLGITMKNIILLVIGLVVIPMLVVIERRAKDPVIKLNYFNSKITLLILFFSLMSGFIMASTINLLPLFIETTFEVNKSTAALGVTPLAITSMIASLIGGNMVTKHGAKKVLFIGFVITALGTLSLTVPTTYNTFLMVAGIIGFGIGIIIGAPLNILIIQATSMAEAGASVGLLSLFRSLGSTIGPTIAGIILATVTDGFFYLSILLGGLSIISLGLFTLLKK